MLIIRLLFLILGVLSFHSADAQVGIGTTSPDSSASFDISSTTKGFLPPRMTKNQRNDIASPAAGLMIWCNDCGPGQIQVFNGSYWTNMIGGVPEGLAVGDNYGGGKVAYILEPGDPGYIPGEMHGLIAAPSDQSADIIWGCMGDLIPGADGLAIGTGYQNTLDIVSNCSEPEIAARICNDLVLGGYDDWYLPSRDELGKLYLNRLAIGGFTNLFYLSSSELDMNLAWGYSFNSGLQGANYKFQSNPVRPIRAF